MSNQTTFTFTQADVREWATELADMGYTAELVYWGNPGLCGLETQDQAIAIRKQMKANDRAAAKAAAKPAAKPVQYGTPATGTGTPFPE